MASRYFRDYDEAKSFLDSAKARKEINDQGQITLQGPNAQRYMQYQNKVDRSQQVGTTEYSRRRAEEKELLRHMDSHGKWSTRSWYKNDGSIGTELVWNGRDASGRSMKTQVMARSDQRGATMDSFRSASGVGFRDGLALNNLVRNFASGYKAVMGKDSIVSATDQEKGAIQQYGKLQDAYRTVQAGKPSVQAGKPSVQTPSDPGIDAILKEQKDEALVNAMKNSGIKTTEPAPTLSGIGSKVAASADMSPQAKWANTDATGRYNPESQANKAERASILQSIKDDTFDQRYGRNRSMQTAMTPAYDPNSAQNRKERADILQSIKDGTFDRKYGSRQAFGGGRARRKRRVS